MKVKLRVLCMLLAFALALGPVALAAQGAGEPSAAPASASSYDAFVDELEKALLQLQAGTGRISLNYSGLPRLEYKDYSAALGEALSRHPALMYALEMWTVTSEGYPQSIKYTVRLGARPSDPVFSIDSLDGVDRAINTMLTCRISSVIVYVRDVAGRHESASADDSVSRVLDDYMESSGDDYNIYITRSYRLQIQRPPFSGTAYRGFFLRISAEYNETLRQSLQAYSAAAKLVRTMPAGLTQTEKTAWVNDTVAAAAEYTESTTPRSVFSAYGALINGRAVCQGYALSAHLMLTMLGLPARIVEGYAGSVPHAWNLVRSGSSWRHVDVTWNDQMMDMGGDGAKYTLVDDGFMTQERHAWSAPDYTADKNLEWVRAREKLHSHEMRFVIGDSNFKLDGMEIQLDRNAPSLSPVITDGRTMLPARSLVEFMGGIVEWTASSKKVTITYKDRRVELVVGSSTAHIDGRAVKLDVAPQLINGFTMVPLRFVAEALDCEVSWSGRLSQATVKYTTY